MDKTTITKLMRVSWEAVARIVVDVVAEDLDAFRLDGLYGIRVDEVSYRKGHRGAPGRQAMVPTKPTWLSTPWGWRE